MRNIAQNFTWLIRAALTHKSLYDLDNSGSISREEIRQVYESIYSLVSNSDYFNDVVDSTTIDDRVDRIFTLMDEVM